MIAKPVGYEVWLHRGLSSSIVNGPPLLDPENFLNQSNFAFDTNVHRPAVAQPTDKNVLSTRVLYDFVNFVCL